MANKIIHKHSSVVTDGKAKIPTSAQLDYGELAVNYAAGVETITLKNSDNGIIEFKPAAPIENMIKAHEAAASAEITALKTRIDTLYDEIAELDPSSFVSQDQLDAVDAKFITTKIVSGTNPTVAIMEENVYYICSSSVRSLTVSALENDANTGLGHYKLIFKVSTSTPAITFPSSILWANGEPPIIIDTNSIYEIDIEKIIIGGTASYRGVVVQFK